MSDAAALRSSWAAIWLGSRDAFSKYGNTTPNYAQAETWYKYAIDIGDDQCGPANLANLFANGRGSRANDFQEAIRLTDITIAAKGECADYAAKLKKLAQDKLAKPVATNPIVK